MKDGIETQMKHRVKWDRSSVGHFRSMLLRGNLVEMGNLQELRLNLCKGFIVRNSYLDQELRRNLVKSCPGYKLDPGTRCEDNREWKPGVSLDGIYELGCVGRGREIRPRLPIVMCQGNTWLPLSFANGFCTLILRQAMILWEDWCHISLDNKLIFLRPSNDSQRGKFELLFGLSKFSHLAFCDSVIGT